MISRGKHRLRCLARSNGATSVRHGRRRSEGRPGKVARSCSEPRWFGGTPSTGSKGRTCVPIYKQNEAVAYALIQAQGTNRVESVEERYDPGIIKCFLSFTVTLLSLSSCILKPPPIPLLYGPCF